MDIQDQYEDLSETVLVGKQTLAGKKQAAQIGEGLGFRGKYQNFGVTAQKKPDLEYKLAKKIYDSQTEQFRQKYKPPSEFRYVLSAQGIEDKERENKNKLGQLAIQITESVQQKGTQILNSIFKASQVRGVGGFDSVTAKFKGSVIDKNTKRLQDFSSKYFKRIYGVSPNYLLRTGEQADAAIGAAVQVVSNWNRLIRSIDQYNQVTQKFEAFQRRRQKRLEGIQRAGVLGQKLNYIRKARKINPNITSAQQAAETLNNRLKTGLDKIQQRLLRAGAVRMQALAATEHGQRIEGNIDTALFRRELLGQEIQN